ncbi:hypothetical protein WOLCODRAFT_73099 [Wolfiporia cocos MD-104 SS10]|uniref:Uncharacterized protein n=1 Tax=Wolfiporia cocos (strain MD-104) TaxID=742152 RepID=A0A2H3JQ26_WOLCO|nr:hypothetical protein WOLCODRAFT_73099 [Wolfiporia cocos MD-104 SS10]
MTRYSPAVSDLLQSNFARWPPKERYPNRYRAKHRVYQDAEVKARAKTVRAIRKQELVEALDNARQAMWALAQSLRKTFGSHSIKYYHQLILQTSRLHSQTHKVSRWNAYLSQEVRRINSELQPNMQHKKSSELTAQISVQWKALTPEEHDTVTANAVEELKDKRENRATARHRLPVQAFHNGCGTLKKMKHELQMLNLRTGIECAIISTRGDLDTYNSPYYYATSKRVADFFEATFKTNLADIGLCMEAYLISRIQVGVVSNHVQELLDLKKQTATLILCKLNETAKTKVPRMYYNNFKTSITAKYGVICEGWPLSKFCCPSNVGSRTELMVLNHVFESSSAHFRAMGTKEFKKWQDKQFQAAIGGVENREDSGSDMSNLSNTILTPPSTLAPATLTPSTLAPQSSAPTTPLPMFVPPPTEQQRGTPLTANFINAVTAADGLGVLLNAKQRKRRSDFGKKRGPHKVQTMDNENLPITIVNAQ